MKILTTIGLSVVTLLALVGTTLGIVEVQANHQLQHRVNVMASQQHDDEGHMGDTTTDLTALKGSVVALTGSATADQVKTLQGSVNDLDAAMKSVKKAQKKICADKAVSNQISSLQGAATAANNAGTYYYDRIEDINAICGSTPAAGD